jgi:glucose-induced degradation protein 8
LLRLQLVELIKQQAADPDVGIGPALNFATEYLAPRAPTNPEWLGSLEKTMALLIFDHKDLRPELQQIIDPQLRVDVAKSANEAILRSTGEPTTSGLIELLQTRVWAEDEACKLGKDLPAKIDIGLDSLPEASIGGIAEQSSNSVNVHHEYEQMAE